MSCTDIYVTLCSKLLQEFENISNDINNFVCSICKALHALLPDPFVPHRPASLVVENSNGHKKVCAGFLVFLFLFWNLYSSKEAINKENIKYLCLSHCSVVVRRHCELGTL